MATLHTHYQAVLLANDRSLHEQGWPACTRLDDGPGRLRAIAKALGMHVQREKGDLRPGRPEVDIVLHKYVRGETLVGDTVGCAQQKSLSRSDNSWFYMEFEETVRRARRVVTTMVGYVCHFDYLVKAEFTTKDKTNMSPECDIAAECLYLGVGRLYLCTQPRTPGVRRPDPVTKRPPEFLHVKNLRPTGQRDIAMPYAGRCLIDLATLQTQLIPTKQVNNGRYYMTANKASSR